MDNNDDDYDIDDNDYDDDDLLLLLHLLPEALLVGERVGQSVTVAHLPKPEISIHQDISHLAEPEISIYQDSGLVNISLIG